MTDVVKKKGWKEILRGRAGIAIPTEWWHLSTDREEDGEKLYELMEQHGYFDTNKTSGKESTDIADQKHPTLYESREEK